jgi:hypothetical protein|tara:strand:- start:34 stop:2022 length:1989 start_codon:yes stop_codon:yes gene_type:complete
MSETRGIFGLTEAVDQKLDDEWVPLNQVFHSNTRFSDGLPEQALHTSGYVWGGYPSPARSSTDRINFATDTAARVPGNTNETREGSVLTSSLTAGYASGGQGGPGSLSSTEKITYSSETYTSLPSSANLSFPKYEHMAGGNSTQGYYVGGLTHGGSYPLRSSTDKITYSNETMARLPGANQPSSTYPSRKGSALSATTHGYFGGGGQPAKSSMDKMVYSVETLNLTPTAFLSTPGARVRAGTESFGYFQIGIVVEKLTYSTDTLERIPGANLSVSRSSNAGTGGPSAGYFIAGSGKSDIEKVNYATDTPSAVPSNLPSIRYQVGGISAFDCGAENIVKPTATPSPDLFQQGPNAGYVYGGMDAPGDGYFSSVEKLNFTSDTTARIPSADSPASPSGRVRMGSAHSSSASYFAGGRPKDQSPYSTVEKLTYTSETMALLPSGSNLSIARDRLAGTSSPSAGYFGGGQEPSGSPSKANRMDKMTFSTDSTSAIPGGNLSSRRERLAATGNTTHGYFGGGQDSPEYTTVDKLTYSNDTTAVAPSAALSVARVSLGAIGNDTHGYFGNGNPGPNGQVSEKLTYATDTSAVIPNLAGPGERSQYATAGNISQGYFIGGTYPTQSTVFKLTYATDVSMSAPGAYLPEAKRELTGSSSRMDGAGSPNIV